MSLSLSLLLELKLLRLEESFGLYAMLQQCC